MDIPITESSIDCNPSLEEIEWNRMKDFRLKEGFIEGKVLGEENKIGCGFNHGCKKGFELSYPFNLIRGILFSNKLLLKEKNEATLLNKSEEIKILLNMFEEKVSKFTLDCIEFTEKEFISTDADNDNSVNLSIDKVCSNIKGNLIYENQVNEINIEFNEVKKKIMCFLKECNQPLLHEKIKSICDNWKCQELTQFASGSNSSETAMNSQAT